jgi:ABC-type glycerol-3-phosphate transport system permease component
LPQCRLAPPRRPAPQTRPTTDPHRRPPHRLAAPPGSPGRPPTPLAPRLIESARVEGSAAIRTVDRIVLPVVKPQLGTLAIFTFITQWNTYPWPLPMLDSQDKYSAPVALHTPAGGTHMDYSTLVLGIFLATLPLKLIFLIFQKQFVFGLSGGAVKE